MLDLPTEYTAWTSTKLGDTQVNGPRTKRLI
jgi:hypothetical protein